MKVGMAFKQDDVIDTFGVQERLEHTIQPVKDPSIRSSFIWLHVCKIQEVAFRLYK